MQSIAYMMAALAILVLGAGTTWVTIIYGAGAALAGPVVTLLSIYSGLRLGRVAMRSAALSSGRSSLIFWANLASGCSVIAVVISLILVGKQEDKTAFLLTMIPVSMIIGELCSLLTLNTLLNRNGPLKLGFMNLWMRPVLICGTAILVAMFERHVISWYFDGSIVVETFSGAIIAGSISLGIAGLYILVLAMMLRRTRQVILRMFSPREAG